MTLEANNVTADAATASRPNAAPQPPWFAVQQGLAAVGFRRSSRGWPLHALNDRSLVDTRHCSTGCIIAKAGLLGRLSVGLLLASALVACDSGAPDRETAEHGPREAGAADLGREAGRDLGRPTDLGLDRGPTDRGPTDQRPGDGPGDRGPADQHLGDRGPTDRGLADAAPDAVPSDAVAPDVGPLDALPDDRIVGGQFAELPGRACFPDDPHYAPPDTGAFELWQHDTGRPVWFVADTDADGRAELFRLVAFDPELSVRPNLGKRPSWLLELEAWDGEHFGTVALMRGMEPIAYGDLDGDGVPELVGVGDGPRQPDDPRDLFDHLVLVRRDVTRNGYRFDEQVERIHRSEIPSLISAHQAWFADSDRDGRMELVTGLIGQRFEWHPESGLRDAQGRPNALLFNRQGGHRGLMDPIAAQIAVGDFDGDGWIEVATSGQAPPVEDELGAVERAAVKVWEAVADDQYRLKYQTAVGGTSADFFAPGDYNGDGRPDFLVGGSSVACHVYTVFSAAGNDQYQQVWRLAAHIPWPEPGFHPSGPQPNSAFADTDGDGRDEIILGLGPYISVYTWTGDTFAHVFTARHCEFCQSPMLYTGDLDGDGLPEIVVSYRNRYVTDLGPNGLGHFSTWIYRRRPPATP